MNSNFLFIAIIIVAAVAGGAVLMQQKKSETVPSQWHSCYKEEVAGPVAAYVEDEYGIPKGWHRQLAAVLESRRQSPEGLPPDIMALPDLSGTNSLPNLRVAMAEERLNGKRDIQDAVQEFQRMKFDDLFAPTQKARDQMRKILFMWAGTADIAPDSRGPFIDARELALLEKLLGDSFYQLGRYPNPLPVAAAYMKDAFAILRNHYFAELAARGAGRELLDYGGDYVGLDRAKFQVLSGRAAGLSSPEDKLYFWQHIVGALPYDVLQGLSPEERRFLDGQIRQSTRELSLQTVLTSLKPDLAAGPHFYDRLGRKVIFKIVYWNNMNSRLTCYRYPEKS